MRLVCGVGINDCPGWASRKNRGAYENRVYSTWYNMLKRCYYKKSLEEHPTYIGCTVCERWLILSNFEEDIKSLPNYDKYISGEFPVLDKDIRVPGNKEYSPQTCMFVSRLDSILDVHRNHPGMIHSKEADMKRSIKQGMSVRAINLNTKEVKVFRSQREASESTGVSQAGISTVITGRAESLKGYKFEKVEVVFV